MRKQLFRISIDTPNLSKVYFIIANSKEAAIRNLTNRTGKRGVKIESCEYLADQLSPVLFSGPLKYK
jgi:hypothetical protein